MRYLRTFRSSTTFQLMLIVISGIGVLYQLLFSPWGNRLLSPVIESILSSTFSAPVSVEDFSLTTKRFVILLRDGEGNSISTQGGYSLLTLRLYAHYRIDYRQKGGINTTGIPLTADGSLSGGISAFDIRGNLHAFRGDALYKVQLRRFKLSSLHAELNRIAYADLLRHFEYPSSSDTLLWGTIDLNGFERRAVKGFIHLVAQTERFTPTDIRPDEESEPFDLRSLLADEYGRVKAFDVNVTLKASVDHAGILEQFAGTHLAGPVALQAALSGDEKRLELRARSPLAQSDTTLFILASDLEAERIEVRVRHADIPLLFDLFTLPSPLTGKADAHGVFTVQGGKLSLSLSDAATLPDVLKREYNLTQPSIRFDGSIDADLSETGVRYRGRFDSDLKRIEFADSPPHETMLRELLKTFR